MGPWPLDNENVKIENSTVLALGGDFRFGDEENAPDNLSLELLANFLSGSAGEKNEQHKKISRFQIAGLVTHGRKK